LATAAAAPALALAANVLRSLRTAGVATYTCFEV
jgi:hypothetical protein